MSFACGRTTNECGPWRARQGTGSNLYLVACYGPSLRETHGRMREMVKRTTNYGPDPQPSSIPIAVATFITAPVATVVFFPLFAFPLVVFPAAA